MFELQNPVADSMGFIYDKSALIEFLRDQRRKGHGQVRCPVAGKEPHAAEHTSAVSCSSKYLLYICRQMLSSGLSCHCSA